MSSDAHVLMFNGPSGRKIITECSCGASANTGYKWSKGWHENHVRAATENNLPGTPEGRVSGKHLPL